MTNLLERWLVWLGRQQFTRPYLVLGLIALTLIPAGWLASGLTLKTSFGELLPDSSPSVTESRRVGERMAGVNTLTVVALSENTELLRRLVDDITPKLRALPPDWVAAVDFGPKEAQKFFEENKALYADLKDIEQLHEELLDRYDWEVSKRAGLSLGLDDDAPPEITAESLEARFKKQVDEARKSSPGIDGYYIGEEGRLAAILVRTPLSGTDPAVSEIKQKIEGWIEAGGYQKEDPKFELHFTGNLITGAEQHQAIAQDLIEVGAIGVGLVLTVVFCFFLRFRALIGMGVTILVGCAWAFGMARLSVGHLNTATGFLVSIIAGNGINFGIIYMARYLEARRRDQVEVEEAILTAHRETHLATLGAAGAAMIAYGSLSITDFRGFKHFGVIAGAGMLLCWLSTYLVLPAVLVISERFKPIKATSGGIADRLRGLYGKPFAWLARKAPRTFAFTGVALGVLGLVLGIIYVQADPMEYDLSNIRNERLSPTSAGQLSVRVDRIVGRAGQDGRAILTERVDQVQPLLDELEQRRLAAPEDKKPFSKVVSVFSLLPSEQTKKIELLEEMLDRLTRAHKRGIISDEEWDKLKEHLPKELKPISIADLPELVARPFTEKDGTRGRIVYIVPMEGRSVYDAHYLMQWADSFREVNLPNGDTIRGTGDPVIFSDMLMSISAEAPKAILLSFLGTCVVIWLTMKGGRRALAAIGILLLGMCWLMAFLALSGTKLNFLNFVALPVSIGVGADYALNVLGRHSFEGDENIDRIVVETGGAVVVCSMATMLGDIALLTSVNRAVQSYGLLAAIGEMVTIFAGMVVLPAFMHLVARRKRRLAAQAS